MVTHFTSHWQRGYDAHRAGVPYESAPCYAGTDTPRACWQNGWKWAEQSKRKARVKLRRRVQLKEWK